MGRKKLKQDKPKKMNDRKRLKLIKSIENIMANGVKDKGRNNNSVTTRNCGRIIKTV